MFISLMKETDLSLFFLAGAETVLFDQLVATGSVKCVNEHRTSLSSQNLCEVLPVGEFRSTSKRNSQHNVLIQLSLVVQLCRPTSTRIVYSDYILMARVDRFCLFDTVTLPLTVVLLHRQEAWTGRLSHSIQEG